ncbi:MAG: hypothetical protein R3195_10350 [Gemmatimonadota bacterium]|nr:hypothetical protein [Gemmatimonadota bacterium]
MPESPESSTGIAWKRLFAEGAAIVVSILLAFAIDASWEGRQEQARVRESLISLRSEFERHRIQLGGVRRTNQGMVDAIVAALAMGDEDVATMSPDSAERLSRGITAYLGFNPSDAALEAMLSSNALEGVADVRLRNGIAAWPGLVAHYQRQFDEVVASYNSALERVQELRLVEPFFCLTFGFSTCEWLDWLRPVLADADAREALARMAMFLSTSLMLQTGLDDHVELVLSLLAETLP